MKGHNGSDCLYLLQHTGSARSPQSSPTAMNAHISGFCAASSSIAHMSRAPGWPRAAPSSSGPWTCRGVAVNEGFVQAARGGFQHGGHGTRGVLATPSTCPHQVIAGARPLNRTHPSQTHRLVQRLALVGREPGGCKRARRQERPHREAGQDGGQALY